MSTENYISKLYKLWQEKKLTDKEFIQLTRQFISNKFNMENYFNARNNQEKEKITQIF